MALTFRLPLIKNRVSGVHDRQNGIEKNYDDDVQK